MAVMKGGWRGATGANAGADRRRAGHGQRGGVAQRRATARSGALWQRYCDGGNGDDLLDWYPLRNARWLQENPDKSATMWATAQGVATLPLAIVGYLLVCVQLHFTDPHFDLPLGPRPDFFIPLMLAIGLFCSARGAVLE